MIFRFEAGTEVLAEYFRMQGLMDEDERVIRLEKPGEGNMNWVARVYTSRRSFIVKQANPYVQKYPQIAAPQERILVEATFYKTVSNYKSLSAAMPGLLGLDLSNHVLMLKDLGNSADYTFLYKKGEFLTGRELQKLVAFLNVLHGLPAEAISAYPENLALRRLNHEHLFVYPLMVDNGFDLNRIQNGLQELAMSLKTDNDFKDKVLSLGQIYLSPGTTLLHGDYYPGSWLRTSDDLKVIDPEFSYAGMREFDLGVFLAHLKMTEADQAQLEWVTSHYIAGQHFNWTLCYQFAGIEIMRRIIGLAQLPFDLTLDEKEKLLKEAYTFIVKG